MDERDETHIISAGGNISDEIGDRVRSLLTAAEDAARAIRSEAEQRAQTQRRAVDLQCQRILATAHAEADALLRARINAISELSASLLERADALGLALGGAQEAREQFERMAQSLADVAERLARERDLTGSVPAVEPLDETAAAEPEAPRASSTPASSTRQFAREDAGPRHELNGNRSPGVTTPRRALDSDLLELPSPAELLTRRHGDSTPSARLVAVQMAVAGGNRSDVDQHLRRAFGVEEPGGILGDLFGDGSDTRARFRPADKVPH